MKLADSTSFYSEQLQEYANAGPVLPQHHLYYRNDQKSKAWVVQADGTMIPIEQAAIPDTCRVSFVVVNQAETVTYGSGILIRRELTPVSKQTEPRAAFEKHMSRLVDVRLVSAYMHDKLSHDIDSANRQNERVVNRTPSHRPPPPVPTID
jgi:hypothetical protein